VSGSSSFWRTLFRLKACQDGAIRPIITATSVGKALQSGAHLLQLAGLTAEFFCPGESQCLHISARTGPVVPELEKLADVFYGETEVSRAADEVKSVKVTLVVIAIAGLAPDCLRYQADILVVSDHPLTDATS